MPECQCRARKPPDLTAPVCLAPKGTSAARHMPPVYTSARMPVPEVAPATRRAPPVYTSRP